MKEVTRFVYTGLARILFLSTRVSSQLQRWGAHLSRGDDILAFRETERIVGECPSCIGCSSSSLIPNGHYASMACLGVTHPEPEWDSSGFVPLYYYPAFCASSISQILGEGWY